ncbi:MAG TPA: ABC transporter permease [Nitrospiraceae bacterium]|nr:ABC transporter permease [Nitrospiraceae bacterium]
MHSVAQDLRFAYRQLRKTPGFTLIIVLTLGLGIGSTAAVFSVVHGVLLRPLPFFRPDRLVVLGDHLGDRPGTSVTAREIGTYGSSAEAVSDTGGYIDASYELSGGATPEQVDAARLTSGVFSTLGVSPTLGRTFTLQEENGHEPVAVISYGLWLSRYHADPHVVGTSIGLDRKTYSIIGVMPRSLNFPQRPDTSTRLSFGCP